LATSQFTSLGNLKINVGNQVYLITAPPDFTQYNINLVPIFTVLFGNSTLYYNVLLNHPKIQTFVKPFYLKSLKKITLLPKKERSV